MTTLRFAPIAMVVLLACGGNSSGGSVSPEAASISSTEIQSSGAATAWDVVDRLHRRWFRDQLSGRPVAIYYENVNVGGADKLRDYPVREVAELQYLDGQAAVRRWGPGNEGGVIMVVRNRT